MNNLEKSDIALDADIGISLETGLETEAES